MLADAGREVRPERVRLPVRRRVRRAHRAIDPDFAKVLVRFNPDGDAEMNERQLGRLKRLADWLHANDRRFLFELLVPAEDAQLESVGGDTRPLRRRAAPGADAPRDRGHPELRRSRSTSGRSRASTRARTPRCWPSRRAPATGRENVKSVLLGRGASRREGRPLAPAGRAGRGLHRLRDRPLDLVGRAEGLPRRRLERQRGGRADRRQLPALRPGLRRRGVRRAGLGPTRPLAASAAASRRRAPVRAGARQLCDDRPSCPRGPLIRAIALAAVHR